MQKGMTASEREKAALDVAQSNLHASIISAIGRPDFNVELIQTFRSILKFESAVLFAFYAHSDRPLCLAERCADPEFRIAHDLYLNRYFNRCESIDRLKQRKGSSELAIIRQSASDIVNPDYRKDLYDVPGIAHDIILLSQVGDVYLMLEFFRNEGAKQFTEEDEIQVRKFWPVALACMNKNSRFLNLIQNTAYDPRQRLGSLIEMFQKHGISRREAEVCSHIALGYSTLATSMHMAISVNTVSTLRQRAYRKLRISCMNELYSLCMQSYSSSLAEPDFDQNFLPNWEKRSIKDKVVAY